MIPNQASWDFLLKDLKTQRLCFSELDSSFKVIRCASFQDSLFLVRTASRPQPRSHQAGPNSTSRLLRRIGRQTFKVSTSENTLTGWNTYHPRCYQGCGSRVWQLLRQEWTMEPWSTEQMTWRHALAFVFKLHLDSPASPPHLSVVIQNLWIAEDRPTLKKIKS